MKDEINGKQFLGALILLVLVFGLFRGCEDANFQYRYNACMEDTIKPVAVLKAIFVCLWV